MATILVVDDNAAAARMLARFIGAHGHRVFTATSGAEALSTAAVLSLDLVLLDMTMPGMDGIEVLRRLRQLPQPVSFGGRRRSIPTGAPGKRNEMPVIFFSAIDDPGVIKCALQLGACDYWIKASFKFMDMPAALERHLRPSVLIAAEVASVQ